MSNGTSLQQILQGRDEAPEFLGDDNDPGLVDPSTVGPGGAAITNATQLRAAIAAAGGTLYVWALPPVYPSEVQIALAAGGFKVQPDVADPGSFKISVATGTDPKAPASAFNLAAYGLDTNTIILLVGGIAGIAILAKVLGGK